MEISYIVFRRTSILLSLLYSHLLSAASATVSVTAVPVAIHGTLSPLVLMIDSFTVFDVPLVATQILVNNYPVIPKEGKKRPFYLKSEAQSHEFVVYFQDKKRPTQQVRFTLPEIKKATLRAGAVEINFAGAVESVLVDGKSIPIENQNGLWTGHFKKSHTIELKGPEGHPGRIYDMKIYAQLPAPTPTPRPANVPQTVTENAVGQQSRFSPAGFQVSGLVVFQKGDANTVSGMVQWVPTFRWTRELSLMGDVGVAPLKKLGGGLFAAVEMALGINYFLSKRVSLAGLMGVQSWLGHGGTGFLLQLQGGFPLNKRFSAFAAYGYRFHTEPSHQARVGLSLIL